jgi:hypothetical protein
MDFIVHWEYLVVLAPALACAMAGFAIHGVPWINSCLVAFKEVVGRVLDTKEHVETMRDFTISFAFIGPAVGLVFGVATESVEAYALAAMAFASAASVAFGLSSLLVSINEREAYLSHRRMAGTVRSIVRSELEKAAKAATPSLGSGDPDVPLKDARDAPILGGPN